MSAGPVFLFGGSWGQPFRHSFSLLAESISLSVDSLSRVRFFVTPIDCSTRGFPVSQQLPELAQTLVHQVGNAIQPSHPVIPFSCVQSFPASGSFPRSQFFTSGHQCMNFSFSISPSNEYSGFISFKIDWFDLLAVQGTLKSFL